MTTKEQIEKDMPGIPDDQRRRIEMYVLNGLDSDQRAEVLDLLGMVYSSAVIACFPELKSERSKQQ